METTDFQSLWHDAGWVACANAWTRRALAPLGILDPSPLQETQVRPWSIVLHTPTAQGTIYFKAAPPRYTDELALTAALARWFPEDIPEVLAAEPRAGWWLARDGGTPIHERLKATRALGEWQAALEQYAKLQIAAAERVPELLALHVPDRRPTALREQYDRLLQDETILRIDRSKGITADEYARLRELSGALARWGEQLESSRVPLSLHHGDLNSGNVLQREGHFYFVDWGDASIGHPFFSLRTVLVSVEIVLGLDDYDPSLAPLRDTYLGVWADFDSETNLRRAFALAQRLSAVVSALSWYRGLAEQTETEREGYEHIVPSLLQEFLHADLTRYPFV